MNLASKRQLVMLGRQAAGLTCAVFSGSMSSGGGGVRAVLTAQNRQPLVHVSPAVHDSDQVHPHSCGG